ncbi:hypothetical protein [Mesorhizobium amorphae]
MNISVLAAVLLTAIPNIASAESLAGSQGDKRFPPTLPGNPKDPCTKAWKAYVAAGGHSAYAITPYSRVRDIFVICGNSLNAKTQAAAEEKAMASCIRTRDSYKGKINIGGVCEIAASK